MKFPPNPDLVLLRSAKPHYEKGYLIDDHLDRLLVVEMPEFLDSGEYAC